MVYIYHNRIDDVSDKALTEEQVFEACEMAIEELKSLEKLIVNSMSGSNILITADHGFSCSFQPLENIHMKKQGGMSLQECVVPVIAFKNIRTGSKMFVDIRKAELQLLSQTRKICNTMFTLRFYQVQPVSGKIVPAEYALYICDAGSKAVSDIQTVIADKTTDAPQERVFHVRFTLKGQEFSETEPYYLHIVEKETANIAAHIAFSIKIAFT